MIRGTVTAQPAPVVRLSLRGPSGVTADVEAIVDTGFTAHLTLAPAVVAHLGLVRTGGSTATLANGSICRYEFFQAEVDWCGVWRSVEVWIVGDETLLGMKLLDGYRLQVDAVPGGMVEITPIP